MLRFVVFVLIMLLFIVSVGGSFAQDQTITPSPAPSKTPEPTGEPDNPDKEGEIIVREITEPFTQNDLSVLTGNVQRPNGLVWYEDKIYAVCNGDWTLYELNDTTGDTRTYVFGIRNSHSLHAETNDNGSLRLWIPDFETNALMTVDRAGAPQTVVPNLDAPWGISVFDEEHFVITSLTGNSIELISREGNRVRTVDQLRSPTGITSTEDTIYVANNGSTRRSIEWISHESFLEDETPEFQSLVSGLQNVTSLVMGADDRLYFTYALGTRGVIGRVDPEVCREQGGCSNDEIEIVVYTELAAPLAGLTISDDMRLFVHTIFRPEIYWLSLGETPESDESG